MSKEFKMWMILVGAMLCGWMLAACSGGGSAAPTQPSSTSPNPTGGKRWSSPPPMTIDLTKAYTATLKTEKGDVKIKLWPDVAPRAVNNFVFLAREGFWDNITFHRVMHDFMAQTGDPTGTGRGGPGYRFEDEIKSELKFDREGLVAYANAGSNTNGSQFFITYVPTPWLNGSFTMIGEVTEGMDVLKQLRERDPQKNPDYEGDKLLTVVIEEQ